MLEQPVTPLDFETERERLSTPFVQRSSDAARQALATVGDTIDDRRAHYAQFSRDEARVLRMIIGDLTRAAQAAPQVGE